jgi:hypothetical protein
MEITIRTIGHVVIYDNIDTFNINTATKDVSGNTDALIEIFKALVAGDSDVSMVISESTVLPEEDRRGW